METSAQHPHTDLQCCQDERGELFFFFLPKCATQTLKLFEKPIVLIMQSHFIALSL